MKLYAISDLHLSVGVNRQALAAIRPHPEDWLIVAGDVGESELHLHLALMVLSQRFAQVLWVPGNHDLWTLPNGQNALRGVERYHKLVAICHKYGALTPEDPYELWPGDGPPTLLAPLFLLYDYTFRPDDVAAEQAVAWAVESGVLCADENLLHPDPYPSRQAWCEARVRYTEQRLAEAATHANLILINHFPLRYDLARLPTIPRFSIWCGTRHSEAWHTRFPVTAAVYGHLHIRATHTRDGVRFEEVSLGYARQWQPERGLAAYLRQILPEPHLL